MNLTRSKSWSEKTRAVASAKPVLFACETCVEAFVSANGRKPDAHERESMPQAKAGHECERCYRAAGFRSAGMDAPADYPTITETLWSTGL